MKGYVQQLLCGFIILTAIGGAFSQEDNCENQSSKCKTEAFTASGLTQADYDKVAQSVANREKAINDLGKDKGCKFVKAFEKCHDGVKAKCTKDDPHFKPILEITAAAETQLKCEEVTCEDRAGKCAGDAIQESGVTQAEIDKVMQSVANQAEEINKIGKEKGCKFVKAIEKCHDGVKEQCNKDDPAFKPILEITATAKTQLKCEEVTQVTCEEQFLKCADNAIKESGVTGAEIDKVITSVANQAEEINKIGKDKGCKFVKSFENCQDGVKEQCNKDDPAFKPTLEITAAVYKQLKCGCASTFASLFLVLASILLVFYSGKL